MDAHLEKRQMELFLTTDEKVRILYALAQHEAHDLLANDWFEGDEADAEASYGMSEMTIRRYMERIRELKPDFAEPVTYLVYALADGYPQYAQWCRGRTIDEDMLAAFRSCQKWMTEEHRKTVAKGTAEIPGFSTDVDGNSGIAYELGLFAETVSYSLRCAAHLAESWLPRFAKDKRDYAEEYLKGEGCARSLVAMCKRLTNGDAPPFIICDLCFNNMGINTKALKVVDEPLFASLRKCFVSYCGRTMTDEELEANIVAIARAK